MIIMTIINKIKEIGEDRGQKWYYYMAGQTPHTFTPPSSPSLRIPLSKPLQPKASRFTIDF